jgi:hypothetical protein
MSNTVNAPFGLRPAYSPSGVIRPTAFTIASGYASNIFQNQPVRIAPSTGGGETEGTIVASAVGAAFIGTFQGVGVYRQRRSPPRVEQVHRLTGLAPRSWLMSRSIRPLSTRFRAMPL